MVILMIIVDFVEMLCTNMYYYNFIPTKLILFVTHETYLFT